MGDSDTPPGPHVPPFGAASPAAPGPPLDIVQRWFQAVVTHPGGVGTGTASPQAQALVRLGRDELERMVRGSSRLSAEQRLAIYANAFYARLLECLGDSFPVTRRVLGGEVFDGFAFDYLQSYPSRSYTLDRLATRFPAFLAETRPPAAPPASDFADFLIDLASFELAIAEVFNGPGCEGEALLCATDLSAADRFAASRLAPVPCLRLLRFTHPVNAFYTAARQTPDEAAEAMDIPPPGAEDVALSRTDFVVQRYTLSAVERALLQSILAGATIGEAVAAAAAGAGGGLADDALAAALDAAFRRFTAAGFFRAIS